MTIVVGFDPDGHGKAVLHLAAMLARSADEDLLVCAVVPAPWAPSPARIDAEYRDYLHRGAEGALEEARRRLPGRRAGGAARPRRALGAGRAARGGRAARRRA